QLFVELQQRLAAGDDDELARGLAPERRDLVGQRRRLVAAAILAVRADEIGVAESALGRLAVLLAPGPEVAAGEAQEDRPAPRLHPLPLEGQKDLLDRIAHGVAA